MLFLSFASLSPRIPHFSLVLLTRSMRSWLFLSRFNTWFARGASLASESGLLCNLVVLQSCALPYQPFSSLTAQCILSFLVHSLSLLLLLSCFLMKATSTFLLRFVVLTRLAQFTLSFFRSSLPLHVMGFATLIPL